MTVLLITLLGLIIGSFIGALSYRLPRGISISKGRSICPSCNTVIHWFDNIPVLSFFVLFGKCRSCKEKISSRYPLIEISTSALFVLGYIFYPVISQNISFLPSLGVLGLPFVLVILTILICLFVVDLEHQILPDPLIFIGIIISIVFICLSGNHILFSNLFYGFAGSLFLLSVFLLTKGRGMGLGDVKLMVLFGAILGEKIVVAMFSGFLTGAVVGIILILSGFAHSKTKIAFGPFLIFGFLIASVFGSYLLNNFFWYL